MAQTTTMTIRIDKKMEAELKKIASYEKRSKSFLAAEAVAQYIEVYEAQVEGIKRAIASADAGNGIPQSKVTAWVESLGTDNELPIPRG